jgi:proteasome lid subunit RPN8/RPN11
VSVRLAPGLRDAMLTEATREQPMEACGLLGGRGNEFLTFIPCRNAVQSTRRYDIALPDILAALREFERENLDLLGIFHSHPAGNAMPSDTDVREAAYPSAVYFIAAPVSEELRAYRIQAGGIQEIQVEG